MPLLLLSRPNRRSNQLLQRGVLGQQPLDVRFQDIFGFARGIGPIRRLSHWQLDSRRYPSRQVNSTSNLGSYPTGKREAGSVRGSRVTVLPAHWQPGHCDNVPQRPTETRKMLAPKRQSKAWTLVPCFGRRTASSDCDPSLRLAAQEDHEIRALAGLRAQLLVRDDQGRPRRRHLGDTSRTSCGITIRSSAVFASLGSFAVGSTSGPSLVPRMRPDHLAVRTSAVQ